MNDIPTVRVKRPGSRKGYQTINKSKFDANPGKYVLHTDPIAAPVPEPEAAAAPVPPPAPVPSAPEPATLDEAVATLAELEREAPVLKYEGRADIDANWRGLDLTTLKTLAASFTQKPIITADEAKEVIRLELDARLAAPTSV